MLRGQSKQLARATIISGQVFKESNPVASVHAYTYGRVVYPKEEYNDAQE